MDIGMGFGQDTSVTELPDYISAVEKAGFHHVTFADISNLANEVNVNMTVAAMSSSSVHIGHGVTDPIMYHPGNIGSAVASLREITNDRAFVGIGTGGPFGKPFIRSAKLAELREAIVFLKAYTAGEEATFMERTWHNEWIRRSSFMGTSVPVVVGACGPKSCRLAGEVGDGLFSGGMDPGLQSWRKRLVDDAAEGAGRDPAEVDFWVRTQIYLAESKQAAFDQLAPYAATLALELWKVLRQQQPEVIELAKRIEADHPGLLARFEAIHDNWDPYWTERIGGPQTSYVNQELIDFFVACGTPDQVREQLALVEEVGARGVSAVSFSIEDLYGMIGMIGDELIKAPAA